MNTTTTIKKKEDITDLVYSTNSVIFGYIDKLNEDSWFDIEKSDSEAKEDSNIPSTASPELLTNYFLKSSTSAMSLAYEILKDNSVDNIRGEIDNWFLQLYKFNNNYFYLTFFLENIKDTFQNTNPIWINLENWSNSLKRSFNYLNRYIQMEVYKNLIFEKIEASMPSLEAYNKIQELIGKYSLNNSKFIESFLIQNDFLINHLKEFYIKINEFFGPRIDDILLEYESDFEEDFEAIFIVIKTNINYEKSIKILDEFYRKYWINIDSNIRQIVGVCIDENLE
jgi:hypothetical protein